MAFQCGLLRIQVAMTGDMAAPRSASEFETAFEELIRGTGDSDEGIPEVNSTRRGEPRGIRFTEGGALSPWDDDERSLNTLDLPVSQEKSRAPGVLDGPAIEYGTGTLFSDYRRSDPRPPQPLEPLLINEAVKRLRYYASEAEADRRKPTEDDTGLVRSEEPSAPWDTWSSAGSDADAADEDL